jgi:hypothetical protein
VDRGSDQIISHPRVIEDSARRKDSKRAKKREKRKEKKALERTQKEEELKRIKNLMKESIKKQLSKIQETSGASGTTHVSKVYHHTWRVRTRTTAHARGADQRWVGGGCRRSGLRGGVSGGRVRPDGARPQDGLHVRRRLLRRRTRISVLRAPATTWP